MACSDYELHEKLLDCPHAGGIQVQVQLDDGCSARLCQDCFTALDVKHWPGLADWIDGPADGLDALQLLRAARDPRE
jgi:hypothetical protein